MTALRVLLLEDVPTDAELVERELRRGGLEFVSRRVAARRDFDAALSDFQPDIILADFSLPGFDGLDALTMATRRRPDVPFVFVSGAIGEERAIRVLKRGATDYVLKDRLARLVPALSRALREARERAERKRAETALARSEARHRVLLEVNNAVLASLDRESLFSSVAAAISTVVPFDRAVLAIVDSRRHLVQAFSGDSPNLQASVVEEPLEKSTFVELLSTSQPCVRQDVARASSRRSRFEEALIRDGLRSCVWVTLNAKSRAVGALSLASFAPDQYDGELVELLAAIGQQVALAVESQLAYEEISALKSRLERENTYLQEEVHTQRDFGEIIGESATMAGVLDAIRTVAATDATVLVLGETGTGKEVVAQAIHDRSPRKDKPLIKVNCAALPATLIESELFGHEKGAFTGAIARKIGRFELADGGTIFLDEIGDLPLELQAKLLRVLQEEEFERVGGSTTVRVKVRVIAATNRDLAKAMEAERFRPDLYYRLAVFPIELPPLRKRREDIPLLADSFVRSFGRKLGKPAVAIPPPEKARLMAYSWPGNIRELKNVIERAVILSRGTELVLGEWWSSGGTSAGPSPTLTLDTIQRRHIQTVLELTGRRVSGERGAAKLLGMKPTTLFARMKKLGIERAPGRA